MSTSAALRTFQPVFRQAFRSHHAPLRTATARPIHLGARSALASSLDVHANHGGVLHHIRRNHSTDDRGAQKPLTDRLQDELGDLSDADKIALRKAASPAYQIHFTCKKCLDRSAHTISKQSYHFGTCVIQCPKCKSQHLISDHLKIFSDTNLTMEDIAKQHGEKLRKGRLGVDGNVEFYDDEATAKVT